MNVFVFLCCGAYDLVIPVLPRYDKPVRTEKAHTVYPSSSSEGISVIMKMCPDNGSSDDESVRLPVSVNI